MQKNNKNILYRRFLNGVYTCNEAVDLFSDINNPVHRSRIENVTSEVWNEALLEHSTTLLEREKYKREARLLLQRIERKDTNYVKRFLLTVASTAAIIAIIFSLAYVFRSTGERGVIYTEIRSGFGEKRQFLLPDGSIVVLNACSRLRYPTQFTRYRRRDVQLQGEAYFDVAKEAGKPFIVSTGHFDVHVLGTAFNVKSYETDELITVDVERGKVQVKMPDAMIQLRAQEQMTMNTLSGDFNKQKGHNETASWRKGWLRFHHTPVRDVARELERMYSCRILFKEGQEFNNLISGEHDNRNLEAVLKSLELVSGIKYEKLNNNEIILYKNN